MEIPIQVARKMEEEQWQITQILDVVRKEIEAREIGDISNELKV